MLQKQVIKDLANYLGDKIELPGAYELFDDFALRIGLTALDKAVLDPLLEKLPEEDQEEMTELANNFCLAIIDEDYELAGSILANILAMIIPTPYVDETEEEVELYNIIIQQLVSFLLPNPPKDEVGSIQD